MIQYEVTFIVDPVLSGDEIKSAANTYVDAIKKADGEIVHIDEMGLRQLAYPINKKSSGVYFCVEFKTPSGEMIPGLELSMKRDDRIMRFLTVRLDKYGIKYNEDKRNGLIGKKKPPVKKEEEKPSGRNRDRGRGSRSNRAAKVAQQSRKPAPAPVGATTTTVATKEEE